MIINNISIPHPLFRLKENNGAILFERFVNFKTSIISKLKGIFLLLEGFKRNRNTEIPGNNIGMMPRKRFDFQTSKLKKVVKLIALILIPVSLLVGGSLLLGGKKSNQSVLSDKIDVGAAKETQDINKEFSFPLKDKKGEVVANVRYLIEKAEFRDEILVDGKRARAVTDRTFLIITLNITNEFKQSIQINTKDYIRLSVNGNKDIWLAPDIHNDPVEVQAISTKYTRVGFPIDDNSKDLILRVGEIDGEKQEIPLTLE